MMKICPNCQHANAQDVNFCENCGTKLTDTGKQCPRCQYLNPSDSRFCENCGYDLEAAADQQEKPVSEQSAQSRPKSVDPSPQSADQNISTASTTGQPSLTQTVSEEQSATDAQNTKSVGGPDQSASSIKSENHAEPTAVQQSEAQETVMSQPAEQQENGTHQSESTVQHPQNGSVPNTSPAQSRATSGSKPDQPLSRTTTHKAKWPWLIALLVLVAVIGGAVYFTNSQSSTSKSTTTESRANGDSAASHSSSVTKSAQSSSKPAQSSFDADRIKDDISTTVGSISGTNSVYVSPVDSKQTVLVNNGSQRSASSIKIFIMVTAYAMAKEGVFNLQDTHTITDSEKVGGTGVIQRMDDGTKLSYQEILEHMIDDSDNTAANIMIEKLGGFQLINNKIKSMGATDTKLRRKMMDTKALDDGRDNTTSAYDMGMTLKKIYNHQLVSRQADDAMLTILSKNQNRTKLPKRLPSEATVYNKTGEYADYGVQNDAEIVKNSRGAFVAVVLSQDGEQTDQVDAMNRLGLMLYQNILE